MARQAYVPGSVLGAQLQAGDSTFTRDDDLYEVLVLAASQAVDAWCFRAFDPAPEEPTTRLLRASRCGTYVWPLPDLSTADDLAVETLSGTTWSPVDADAWWVETAQEGDGRVEAPGMIVGIHGSFPTGPRPGIRVEGRWGWPATPEVVKQATLLLARRYYTRKDSPAGVLGFGDMGAVRLSRLDPDVVAMLGPYRLKGLLLA